MKNLIERQKRSEKLSGPELQAYRKYVDGHATILDCAGRIGLNRDTVSDIYAKGSGRGTTIALIRRLIG